MTSEEKRTQWDDVTELIYAEIQHTHEGLSFDQLLVKFGSYVDTGKNPSKGISIRCTRLAEGGYIHRDADGVYHEGVSPQLRQNGTPKGIDPALKAYLKDRPGVVVEVFYDPAVLQGVVAIEFSIDGKNWYPIDCTRNLSVSIGKSVPDWGSRMNIYRDIKGYRLFGRKNGGIEQIVSENCEGMGIIITTVPK